MEMVIKNKSYNQQEKATLAEGPDMKLRLPTITQATIYECCLHRPSQAQMIS